MNKSIKHILFLVVLSYIFFMFGNGLLPLSDPDEVFYAQTTKEMILHHEWNIPFLFGQPQFEKPIFIYWLLRIAFLIFGMTDFGARFFPALFATLGVIAVYLLAKLAFNDTKKAIFSAIVLMSNILYIGLARTVFTDMVFSVFILMALLSFFWGYSIRRRGDPGIILFFLFAALATLTKGPLGLLLPFAAALFFLLIRRDVRFFFKPGFFIGVVIFSAVALPWYIYITAKYGNTFIREFFYNDHIRRVIFAEHLSNDRWYFYPGSILGLFFPWTFFLVAAMYRLARSRPAMLPSHQLLLCWVAVVFVIFQAAHSKLIGYVLPLFPPLAMICGDYISDLIKNGRRRALSKTLFLSSWSAVMLLFAGVYLVVFKLNLLSPSLVIKCVFAAVAPAYLLFTLFFILRTRLRVAFYMLALTLPLLLVVSPIDKEKMEPYFSSEDISAYLQKQYPLNDPILVAKPFARGILYYTKKRVVIFAPGESDFFSPHPVVFLNTEEKVSGFLRRNGTTYCVIKKKQSETLKSIAQHIGFRYEMLLSSGNVCLFKVAP